MAECLDCIHAIPFKDSHGEYRSICNCVESDNFLHPVDRVFGSCEFGKTEEDEEDT